ncbi:MAG: tRNA pseudouridine(13) synthase TruD [Planctomycetes bacterium]|nr:tRNA pseudouridine(13) synthase TruD [Planctomycetota bacterium]MCB9910755.1 tRNA pseudouridine(13) synthase TruD [Planctomycetota bacterium]MCB9912781.1 tRNA pseudouridine(13) synthase TruD [Planctomycetota bacterium]HPF14291.1 tRNA pseudouridine(13) synthase TruD [Planctomycetota bacterium]HRV80870.1 tRNA pseudouridine(13) synthase TruD [Planctomycetota bacterium]
MRLKQKPQDFRVRELLREDFLQSSGDHRVYRVSKIKATSIEAARGLAELAGVSPSDVSMAGLKDRQGITEQFMTIPRGREVFLDEQFFKIDTMGFSHEAITSVDSRGNAFEIVSRGLGEVQLRRLRAGLATVREFGLPNYFDEQRFGNLRHGQGWIALDLLRGDVEGGLKRMMASISKFEHPESRMFKQSIWQRWGDWRGLRDVAGRFGKHHSVFDHLRKEPTDFAGAFTHLATRERVIHQFAFQSHLWNRAVARWLKLRLPQTQRFFMPGIEGPLVFPIGPLPIEPGWGGRLPLPGTRLEGLVDDIQRELFVEILRGYGVEPDGFEIEVPGFAFKADERALAVMPTELRARPAEPDRLNPGSQMVRFSFELPRGAYASLVVKRLIGPMAEGEGEVSDRQAGGFRARRGARRGAGRGRGGDSYSGRGSGSYDRTRNESGGPRAEGGGEDRYRNERLPARHENLDRERRGGHGEASGGSFRGPRRACAGRGRGTRRRGGPPRGW